MILVIGGSASGKSSYAEDLITEYDNKKYYIATMEPFSEESHKRIERHRLLRAGKGFETAEIYRNVGAAPFEADSVALLECVGNVVANEMFLPDGSIVTKEKIVEKVYADITELSMKIEQLVVVSNDVASDIDDYDVTTMDYVEAISTINNKLSADAEAVYEVVCGIPIPVK